MHWPRLAAMTLGALAKSSILRIVPQGLPPHLCAPVLTYHACYPVAPPNVESIDNIDPQSLYEQLSALKRHFQFIPVDELSKARSLNGLASVTFDDAYKGVIRHALPVLTSLDIPLTIFVNTSTLQGSVHWRHKVVYIIRQGLAKQVDDASVENNDYYQAWKQPRYDSGKLVERIDAVLRSRNVTLENHLFDDESCFVRHPLVWYGNHSHSHYVLSSLSRSRQLEEVLACKRSLEKVPGIQTSKVFALPFGETRHCNMDTFGVVRDLGYTTLLMNRGGVNMGSLLHQDGLTIIERFSPAAAPIDWQVKKECAKTLIRSARNRFRQPAGDPTAVKRGAAVQPAKGQ
jgi:peptidoglycan/xylan/chitin deacetylase (PgdA/CDA1 family)